MLSRLIKAKGGLRRSGGGLRTPGGGLLAMLRGAASAAPTLLADFDFSAPVVQSFGSANATHRYLMQELSGNYADTGTGTAYDIDTFTAGLQAQARPGIWNGSSYIAINAWETDGATARAAVSNTSVFDSNNTDLYFRIEFAISATPAAAAVLTEKRDAANAGWTVEVQTDGTIDVIIEDAGANTATVSLVGNLCDGAPHYLEFFYDDSADELTVNSDIDLGNAATNVSAVSGSLTNSVAWRLGDPDSGVTAGLFQIFLAEGAEGAAAATMLAESGWWANATDPSSLLDPPDRGSLISVSVASTAVAHFADDTLPIGFDAAFSAGYGLYCNNALTNIVLQSEQLGVSGWNDFNTTRADNQLDSPDGFRSASTVTASANDGAIWDQRAATASEYTLSCWVKRGGGSDAAGKLKLYDTTNAAFVGSTSFTATDTWQLVTVTGTMLAGCIAQRHYCYVDISGESISFSEVQHNDEDRRSAYARTAGGAASIVQSDYRATGDHVNEDTGELEVVFVKKKMPPSGDVHYVYDTVTAADRRALYIDDAGALKFLVNDSAGSLVATITLGTVVVDTEYTAICQWDKDAGLDSNSVRGKVNAVAKVSGGSGFTAGGGYTVEICLGASDTTPDTALDGFIQYIRSRDSANAMPT